MTTDRFFGTSNYALLCELGLTSGSHSSILADLRSRALKYAGLSHPEALNGSDFAQLIADQVKPPVAHQSGVAANRPSYIKNDVDFSPSKHSLITIQLVRQAHYPRWLSSPYPGGEWIPVPQVAVSGARADDLLSWGIPLILEPHAPMRLPGTHWKAHQLTDGEARALDRAGTPLGTIRAAWSNQQIVAPKATTASSIYTFLNPAWGLYTEAVFKAMSRPQDKRLSARGRHLKALELTQLLPILAYLERQSELVVLGAGNGKIHARACLEWQDNGNLERVCDEALAYAYTRQGPICTTTASPDNHTSAFFSYKNLLASASQSKIESVINL